VTLTIIWLTPLIGGVLIAFMPPHWSKLMAAITA